MIKQETSAEVYNVIRAKHGDQLRVNASNTRMSGGYPHGMGGSLCGMYTEYGFEDADCSFIAAQTTWELEDPNDIFSKRIDEQSIYWLLYI